MVLISIQRKTILEVEGRLYFVSMGEHDLPEEVMRGEGWKDMPDLTSMPEEELRKRLDELVEEEHKLNYQRRIVQGEIDVIRAELVRRGGVTLSAEELARVLMGEEDTGAGEES